VCAALEIIGLEIFCNPAAIAEQTAVPTKNRNRTYAEASRKALLVPKCAFEALPPPPADESQSHDRTG